MAETIHSYSIIREEFLKPLFEVFNDSKLQRNCNVLSDSLWVEAGIRRCLYLFGSGRDLLQHLSDVHDIDLRTSTFFESLKSKRRLAHLDELSTLMRAKMKRFMPDPFESHRCLDDFDIYAGDGHFIAAATHDKAVPRRSAKNRAAVPQHDTTREAQTKYATGQLYTLDLRSHGMSHLTVADQVNRKKEHEMRALKRLPVDVLRQGAGKGRKVLYIWDRAGIDFQQWYEWKHRSGIYFLSREKENMNLQVMGNNPYDTTLSGNAGIIADETMGTNVGVSIRRVTFRDPETGVVYRYLTNLPDRVPPGIVALLYKSRWDVEKVFDEFKNKLGETKSWASSATAKTNQSRLICLTHNLMTLMEETIRRRSGVVNRAELNRREKIRDARGDDLRKKRASGIIPHIGHAVGRLSQRTVKFIRWLKNHLDLERDWDEAMAKLSKVYEHS